MIKLLSQLFLVWLLPTTTVLWSGPGPSWAPDPSARAFRFAASVMWCRMWAWFRLWPGLQSCCDSGRSRLQHHCFLSPRSWLDCDLIWLMGWCLSEIWETSCFLSLQNVSADLFVFTQHVLTLCHCTEMFATVTVRVTQISLTDLKMVRNAAVMAQSDAFTFFGPDSSNLHSKNRKSLIKQMFSPEILLTD